MRKIVKPSRRSAFPSGSLFLAALTIVAGTTTLTTIAKAVNTVPETGKTLVAPHRAVYDLKLKDSLSSANIADASGRMVFEVTGSKCEGYLVNMRFILTVVDSKGATNVTDVRSSSWEDGAAQRFRFNTTQYFNQKLSKTTAGNATRNDPGVGISVKIDRPKPEKASFEEKTYFPTEHTRLMIKAALSGKKMVAAPIYDGSENGNTLYDTTAFIGKALKSDQFITTSKIKNIEKLKDMISWPVAIAFYDKKKSVKQDLLPDYEIAFRLYENGVSRSLIVDYGDFALDGTLKEIKFYEETSCE